MRSERKTAEIVPQLCAPLTGMLPPSQCCLFLAATWRLRQYAGVIFFSVVKFYLTTPLVKVSRYFLNLNHQSSSPSITASFCIAAFRLRIKSRMVWCVWSGKSFVRLFFLNFLLVIPSAGSLLPPILTSVISYL